MLRPHCEQMGQVPQDVLGPVPDTDQFMKLGTGHCPNFDVIDPHNQQTPVLANGSVLDMDLIVFNPQKQKIHKVRAWMSYDPSILEGVSIDMDPRFSQITPGESDFDAAKGNIQIGATSDDATMPSDSVIQVARVQVRMKGSPSGGPTPIVFEDLQPGTDGHTFVTTKNGATDQNILPPALGTLLVRFTATAGVSSSMNSSTGASTSSTPLVTSNAFSSASPPERTSFVLLQVQNLRVTTDQGGTTMYAAWDPLRSSDLAGYNLYYGTQRGQYIQRHSIPLESTSTAVRGLVAGQTYYLAIRAVNGSNEETAFSREVSITVGSPRTSTAPLVLGKTQYTGPQGKNPLDGSVGSGQNVPGQSGSSTTLVLFLVISAVIGTLFACRRQYTLSSPTR